MNWRIGRFLHHMLHIRHRYGRGIHSPFVFGLVHGIVFNGERIRVPRSISLRHREILSDRRRIPAGRAGSGSRADRSEMRTVRSFASRSSVSPKYGGLLYRAAHWFRPEVIIELGSGLGISTLYLASGSHGAPVHSVEADPVRAGMAESMIRTEGLHPVTIHRDDAQQALQEILLTEGQRILAFIDANHRYEPTLSYVRSLLHRAGEEAVVILDDIYWSREMNLAWKELRAMEVVGASVDLFRMGILVKRPGLAKTSCKIFF